MPQLYVLPSSAIQVILFLQCYGYNPNYRTLCIGLSFIQQLPTIYLSISYARDIVYNLFFAKAMFKACLNYCSCALFISLLLFSVFII